MIVGHSKEILNYLSIAQRIILHVLEVFIIRQVLLDIYYLAVAEVDTECYLWLKMADLVLYIQTQAEPQATAGSYALLLTFIRLNYC